MLESRLEGDIHHVRRYPVVGVASLYPNIDYVESGGSRRSDLRMAKCRRVDPSLSLAICLEMVFSVVMAGADRKIVCFEDGLRSIFEPLRNARLKSERILFLETDNLTRVRLVSVYIQRPEGRPLSSSNHNQLFASSW